MRKCDHCGKQMMSGFVVGDGLEYYCSEPCLYQHYTEEEYELMYQTDGAYWTEWEDQD